METKHLSLDASELKFSDSGMVFTGYASIFGGVDTYGDTIHPGAFKRAIQGNKTVVMYYNHGWKRDEVPIGKLDVVEDSKGLYVERAEFTQGIKLAEEVYLAAKHRTVTGLSIGYKLTQDGFKRKAQGGRDIYEIKELKEVSVVDFPADHKAQIYNIKSALEEAGSLKEIEALLRDAGGFSRMDATALVARIKSLHQSDSEAEEKLNKAAIAQIFEKFSLTV
jgi:HK97 family phage prohead protease